MRKIKVLYIDDEVNNLHAFKASFRRDFTILLANSSYEALNILAKEQVDIIISDQKMPKRTGVEFFEIIVEKYQKPIRILLTGYSDIEAVINAINKGKVYSYVTKPWNDFDLRQMIYNAYDYYKLREENGILSNRYQKVFKDSSDLMLIFNEQQEIIEYNDTALTILNPQKKERKLQDFFKDKSDCELFIKELKAWQKLSDFECQLIDVLGNEFRGLISANIIRNVDELPINYQIIVKDVTARNLSNKQVLKKIIEAQESERRRVADDLHDSLGQELSSVKMMIGVLKDGNLNAEKQKEITVQCHQILEDTISNLRNICFDLMPSALERGGFIPAFKQLVQPLFIDVNYDITTSELPLNLEQQIALYRVSQEFVNNTIKHSEATQIKLSIFLESNSKINITLEDNGIGFNVDELLLKRGRGQNTMLKRIESYGGKSKLESEKGKGTILKITFEC
ncbi:MAG: response regulator [Flavobacteriales bacterium]|jgi:signal transduction histidine kinase|nr:response regulator [Flavobacteriales bacterium]